MLTMIKTHANHSTQSAEDARLIDATHQLIAHFQQLSGMTFSSNNVLINLLFAHPAPAIERYNFNIGIGDSLREDVLHQLSPACCEQPNRRWLPSNKSIRFNFLLMKLT
jgi:transcriptional antiterminator